MTSDTTGVSQPKWMKWTGFALSGLVIAFMAMDVTMKLCVIVDAPPTTRPA